MTNLEPKTAATWVAAALVLTPMSPCGGYYFLYSSTGVVLQPTSVAQVCAVENITSEFVGLHRRSLRRLPLVALLLLKHIVPAPLVYHSEVGRLKRKVEPGMVKAGANKLGGPSYSRSAPKQQVPMK